MPARRTAVALIGWITAGAAAARPDIAGRRVCAGADTLHDLAEDWARILKSRHPAADVQVARDAALSADGFARLLNGETACAPFVRELFPSERAAFQDKYGYAPQLVTVASGSFATLGGTHAIAIYVNAANPIDRMTMAQVRGVLTGEIRSWGELGAPGPWRSRPVSVHGMLRRRPSGDPPGIVNYIRQRALDGGELRPDIIEHVDTPGETALTAIVRAVAEDQAGLGFSGFLQARDGAKALALSETADGPFVTGSRESVAARRYPLTRSIYVLVNRPPGQPIDPVIGAFLGVALGAEGQAALDRDRMKFLPLPADHLARARAALE